MTPADLAASLAAAAARLTRELSSRRPPGLSASEAAVLADLAAGPQTPGALAATERMTSPSMTRHIGALESRELIERKPDPADKRRVQLSLTEAGRDALNETQAGAWLAGKITELSSSEQELLRNALLVLAKLHMIRDAKSTE